LSEETLNELKHGIQNISQTQQSNLNANTFNEVEEFLSRDETKVDNLSSSIVPPIIKNEPIRTNANDIQFAAETQMSDSKLKVQQINNNGTKNSSANLISQNKLCYKESRITTEEGDNNQVLHGDFQQKECSDTSQHIVEMIDCSVTQNSSQFFSKSTIVKPQVNEDNRYLDNMSNQNLKAFDLQGKDDIVRQPEEGAASVSRGTTVGEYKECKVGTAVAEDNTKICELVRICSKS